MKRTRKERCSVTPDQVRLFTREGEGLSVEFKERYTTRIDQDIVAFANAKGGTILLGVRDDGTVVGERLRPLSRMASSGRSSTGLLSTP